MGVHECSDQTLVSRWIHQHWRLLKALLSCQPRVTLTSGLVNKVIRDLESIDHLCITPIHRIGLIHK